MKTNNKAYVSKAHNLHFLINLSRFERKFKTYSARAYNDLFH